MNDTVPEHGSIGADHLRHRQRRRDLHRRYTRFFQFCRNRSAAASTGTSGRRENDRVDAQMFRLLGHLAAHAPGIRQRIRQP